MRLTTSMNAEFSRWRVWIMPRRAACLTLFTAGISMLPLRADAANRTTSAARPLTKRTLRGTDANKELGQRPVKSMVKKAAEPKYTAYLMAYFGPEEKLYYAYSRDARHWTALNGGKPVMDPGVRLRDPFLNRVNGVFHLVHTVAWDTTEICHWESLDLIHWKGGAMQVVRPEQKRAWAPEFIYAPSESLFYVLWASEYQGHNAIYYVTTKDWKDITPDRAAVYYDLGIDDIDIDIIEHKGTYYAFHKPGTVDDMMGNMMMTSRSLDPLTGGFGRDGKGKDVVPGGSKPIEGPEAVKLIGQDRWYVYGDPFHSPMEAWETTNFRTFTKIEVATPDHSKHCSMVPITDRELEMLMDAYPVRKP